MGIFLSSVAAPSTISDVLRLALMDTPPADEQAIRSKASRLAASFPDILQAKLQPAIDLALREPAQSADTAALTADAKAAALQAAAPQVFHTTRLLNALALFGLLLAGGIAANILNYSVISSTLFTLATTAFGVIGGIIGSEKAGS